MILVSIGLLTALAIYSARRIEIRFAFRSFFDYQGNPDVATIDRYHEHFEDPAGFVAVVIESDDVYSEPALRYVATITTALEPFDIFSHVRSLTNARAIRWTGDAVDVGTFLPEIPTTKAGADRARAVARDSRLLDRMLVSQDSKATLIAAQLKVPPSSSTLPDLRHAVAIVERAVADHPPPAGLRVRITGAPVLEVEASDALVWDQIVFTPIAILLIVIALWFAFRCVHGVVMPVIAISIAAVWTAGLYPLFGRPVDMVASTIPATLLVYGATDPIFVLRRYLDKLRAGLGKEAAIEAAYSELTLPCFLTSFTTAIGFASFATLDLPIIVNFGAVMAVGVMLAFLTTMVVLPLLLAMLPVPPPIALETPLAAVIDRWFTTWWRWLGRHRRRVLLGGATLISAGALYGSTQTISVYYTRILPPGATENDIRLLERKFVGVIRSALFLEGPPETMKRPEVLQAIERVDETASKFPIVTAAISLPDVIKEMNRAFMEGDPAEYRVPKSANLSAQYLQMLDPEDRQRMVTVDESRTHIMIFSMDRGTAEWRPMRDAVMEVANRELVPLGVKVSMTEQSPAGFDALDALVYDVLEGFIIAFISVLIIAGLIFRSLRIAILSIFPNILPVIVCFVLLRAFDITLRVGTVLFLSVSVGGLFNVTIQLVARLRLAEREGGFTHDEAVERTMRDVGPPALFTAVILSLGFAIFGLSRFPDLRVFGLLASTALVAGFVSDMMLTTTLLRVLTKWSRR